MLLLVPTIGAAAEPAFTEAVSVWIEREARGDALYVSHQRAGRWSVPRKLTEDGGAKTTPAVAADTRGNVWSAWAVPGAGGQRIEYLHLQGERVAAQGTLDTPFSYNMAPSLALDEDGVAWLVWSGWSELDGKAEEIYFSRWDGATWERPARVNGDDGYPDILPLVGIDRDGRPVVTWSGFDGERYRSYQSAWTGSGWGREQMLGDAQPQKSYLSRRAGASVDLPARARNRPLSATHRPVGTFSHGD